MTVRRALVTGATGGLGRALVPALIGAGYEVRATGRDARVGEGLARSGARFVQADLLDPAQARALAADQDVVFHAAAMSSPWGHPDAFRAINVEATRALLAAAQVAGCDAFIFISTPSVYAEPRDRLALTEASPIARNFANAYVATKFAAETLVRAADGPGLTTIALRPKALVGPHDQALLPRILRVARTGRFPAFRQGQALVELTDVRDAALAILAADRHRIALGGRVFNISGGTPLTVSSLLDRVFETFGVHPRRIDMPYPLAAGLARAMETIWSRWPGRPEPPATVYSLGALAFSQTFDLTAAYRDLDWRPRHGPDEAIAWAAEKGVGDAPV